MEPLVRIERTTYWLQVSCSTSWAKVALVTPTGIEPMSPPWKGDVLTAWPRGHKSNRSLIMVSHRRLELRTTWLKVKCSANWANGPSKYIAISFTTDCAYIILQFEALVNRFYLKKRKKLKFANEFNYSTNYYLQKL